MKMKRFLPLILLFVFSCASYKIESQIKDAEELIGMRKFDEAVKLYNDITGRFPNNKKTAKAFLSLGDLYFYTIKSSPEALKAYSEVIKKWPFSEYSFQASQRMAELYTAEGRIQKAIEEYEWASEHFPEKNTDSIRLNIAEMYLMLYDPYQASVELERLLGNKELKKEIKIKAFFDLGESYMFLKKYKEAFDIFTSFIKDYPDSDYYLDTKLRMVDCLEKMDRADEAIKLQEEISKENPDSSVIEEKRKNLVKRNEKTKVPN